MKKTLCPLGLCGKAFKFMTLEKAREIIADHVFIAGGYNQTATKMILGELNKDQGQQAVDQIIREFSLDELWGFMPGTHFESTYK